MCVTLRNKLYFLRRESVAPLPTPRLEDHPLEASPPFAIRGRTVPLLHGTHLGQTRQVTMMCSAVAGTSVGQIWKKQHCKRSTWC
jgi:hypothetical protein